MRKLINLFFTYHIGNDNCTQIRIGNKFRHLTVLRFFHRHLITNEGQFIVIKNEKEK